MENENSQEKQIYKIGAWCGIFLLALVPLQIFFFIKFPPPEGIAEIYGVFEKSVLIGLINMDILYLITNIVMLAVYLGLYFLLRPHNPRLALLAMALTFTGVAAFIPSNPAFSMLELAGKYSACAEPVLQAQYVAAGEAVMSGFTGSAYVAYYYMNFVGLFLISFIMLKSRAFGKLIPAMGLISAFFMSVPSSFGAVGMAFSLISIIPYAVWLAGIIMKFFRRAAS